MEKTFTKLKDELYRTIDSFLVESKDQNGNERSIERLNQDRHLAVEKLLQIIDKEKVTLLTSIQDELMNGNLRDEFESIFEKDQEAIEGIRPSKSNRSGALLYNAKIQVYLTKLIEELYD